MNGPLRRIAIYHLSFLGRRWNDHAAQMRLFAGAAALWSPRARPDALPAATIATTTMRVIDRVHHDTAHRRRMPRQRWAPALPMERAVPFVADFTNGRGIRYARGGFRRNADAAARTSPHGPSV